MPGNAGGLVAGMPLLRGPLSQNGKLLSHRGQAVTVKERDVVGEIEVTSGSCEEGLEGSELVRPGFVSFE